MSKAQFVAQSHVLTNHVPSVDLGAFDLTIVPGGKRAEVVTRVYLEAQPNSQLQLIKFGKQFSKLVPEVWNKKARFKCTKATWNDIVLDLAVRVEVVGLANAHFRIEVQDEDALAHAQGPFAMVTEKKFAGAGVNPAFAPREGKFGAAAVNKGEIEAYRRNVIFDLSKSTLTIPVKASPAQDPYARQRLEKFAREIMQLKIPKKFNSSQRPTLTVNGCGPGNRQAIATSVEAFLRAFGVKNPISKLATGSTTSPEGVELSFDNNELKRMFPVKPGSTKSLFQQITVAHEFGHMIGLPDEYLCMHALTGDAMENIYAMTAPELNTFKGSGMQIADVKQLPDGTINVPHIVRHQSAFVTLCNKAALVPPEFGRMSPSLMSNGMVFHPHHFVTIWEAICMASGFDDWQIEVKG